MVNKQRVEIGQVQQLEYVQKFSIPILQTKLCHTSKRLLEESHGFNCIIELETQLQIKI